MASRDMEMRSPAERRMSISRAGASWVSSAARSSSSSVVSPMAETTTHTRWPARTVSATRRATRWMPAASATEEPPNFWTMRLMGPSGRSGVGSGQV